jgi:putative ABC transport system permease protein
MHFAALIVRNVTARKVRAILTGLAIALAIMTVVTLGILTQSLRKTALSIIETGDADFTVAQTGVADVLSSIIDGDEVERIKGYEGVDTAIGTLISAVELDSDHPFFLQIGLPVEELAGFGVEIIVGRAFEPDARDEMILGYRAARDLGLTVGDTIRVDERDFRIVGIFSTGQESGDSGAMLALTTLQANERKPNIVTLVFVRVNPETDIDALRGQIENDMPNLTTVRTETEFGRVDRNLELISAANTGVTILALIIGAITVMNTMMLSVFERTREFGILRAVGWPRWRVIAEVMGEALVIAFIAAMAGVGLGFIMVKIIEQAPDLVGVFEPDFTADVFGRALAISFGMAFIGALYPAVRAALLAPLTALRHE